jgi:hypothetical protein
MFLLFQIKDIASSVHFTGGWAVHRKIAELQVEKNLSYPYRKSNPDPAAHSQ